VWLHKKAQKIVIGLVLVVILGMISSGCIGGDDKSTPNNVLYSEDISLSPDEMKNITLTIPEDGTLTIKYEFKAPDEGPTILSVAIKQNGDYLNAKVIFAKKGESIKGSIPANVTAGDVTIILLNGANAVETPITYHIEVVYDKSS